MIHPFEQTSADLIRALSVQILPQKISNNTPIAEGIFFSWDDVEGEVEFSTSREEGQLLGLNVKVLKTPRWFSLNVSLGKSAFAPGAVLGVVAEIQGDAGTELPLLVRSIVEGKPTETALYESLMIPETRHIQAALHTIEVGGTLTGAPCHQTLVIRLPKHSFNLNIFNLRVFVVPASQGLRSIPATLSMPGA